MQDVKIHLSERELKALDAQFALQVSAFLGGFCDEAPEAGEYEVSEEREAVLWEMLLEEEAA